MISAVPKPVRRLLLCPRCGKAFRVYHRWVTHSSSCGLPPKPNKYNARKTGDFPSKLEHDVHEMLLKVGTVKRYPSVELVAGIRWKVDFMVTFPNGDIELHEAKGAETSDYRLKKKIYAEVGTLPLRIWKRKGKGAPVVVETIRPKRMQANAGIGSEE